jgi:hypothetical protein
MKEESTAVLRFLTSKLNDESDDGVFIFNDESRTVQYRYDDIPVKIY